MSNSWPPCFIKFRVTDQARFHILVQAFEMLKQEKHTLTEATFGDNKGQILEDEENQYGVLQEKTLRKLIDSLFDLFDEQILSHFWLLTLDIGVFEFLPFAFPYGGRGCMKALIGAFDSPIIGEDYGTGYISLLEAKMIPEGTR